MRKEEADRLMQIKVSFLKKHKYFENGIRSGDITWSINGNITGKIGIRSFIYTDKKYIELIYTQTDNITEEKTDFDYQIPLTTTPCQFGGQRFWFICPMSVNNVYCGRRVGSLYISNKYFACRHCNNLTYNSRNLSGIFKKIGQTISSSELDDLYLQIKRKKYAGKYTKKYRKLLYKNRKAELQLMTIAFNGDKKRASLLQNFL